MSQGIHSRMMAQLRLALANDCACQETLSRVENDARVEGLTGAEIDAALEGRSFEAKTAVAIEFACAIKTGDDEGISRARARAHNFGLDDSALGAIEEFVDANRFA